MTIEELHQHRAVRLAALASTIGPVRSYRARVQCVETRRWFKSLSEAARHHDGNAPTIHYAVRTGCRAYGFHWRREGQAFKAHPRMRRRLDSRQVMHTPRKPVKDGKGMKLAGVKR